MTPEHLASKIQQLAEQYPAGCPVWHRANGKRGVVCEYCIDATGCAMLSVDWGGSGWDKCVPQILSATKVNAETDDGETWR